MHNNRMSTVYDFTATTLAGTEMSLAAYRGKTLLIVNVASRCTFTGQYAGLETLFRKYADRGFVILGFPCDQFGHQEPGDADEIERFCRLHYGVTFPMFAKIKVNGAGVHPLYAYLKSQAPGVLGTTLIKWNFTKFLVERTGRVVGRYAPATKPESLEANIVSQL